MNATMGINYEDMEMSYAVDFGRDREPTQNRSRRPAYRRAGSGPARVNGIHHRRSKRWTWGSGRGARMQNLRAFAGCLAVAVAGFASSALGGAFRASAIASTAACSGVSAVPGAPDWACRRARGVDTDMGAAVGAARPPPPPPPADLRLRGRCRRSVPQRHPTQLRARARMTRRGPMSSIASRRPYRIASSAPPPHVNSSSSAVSVTSQSPRRDWRHHA